MRRLRLTVAYDGTEFFGWQVQPALPTIQGRLEQVLSEIEESPVSVIGSGRTDAGVHARGQVASFDLRNPIPCPNLRKAINRLLPDSIRVLSVDEADEGFHARHHAIAKTYEYRIARDEICLPFDRRYVHHHPYPLDHRAMIELAKVFEGLHDFSAFAAADERYADGFDMRRQIYTSRLEERGGWLVYTVRGNGFLKHMVRNMVGALIDAGRGNTNPREFPNKYGATAPACGLFLDSVEY
jgi:tRNA pseudouridine38-40 synthase